MDENAAKKVIPVAYRSQIVSKVAQKGLGPAASAIMVAQYTVVWNNKVKEGMSYADAFNWTMDRAARDYCFADEVEAVAAYVAKFINKKLNDAEKAVMDIYFKDFEE